MRFLPLCLLLLSAAPAALAAPAAEPPEPPGVGDAAPDFALPDADGVTHSLAELRGAPAVINFWASWCGPCLSELPRLEEARATLQERGVAFVLINLDRQRGPALGALKRFDQQMLSLFDPRGQAAAVWAPPAMPTTWVLGADGRVLEVLTGALDDEAMAALVDRLRALPSGPAP